ncbi:MAG: oligogalacturonate lyase, partial [Opitutus sp.]|nr:oligogalacturonate lyase [Opitutus sp.]
MHSAFRLLSFVAFFSWVISRTFAADAPPADPTTKIPSDWIDLDTGHRVIRLSPDNGGSSLYFHQNGYTPEGDKLIIHTRDG